MIEVPETMTEMIEVPKTMIEVPETMTEQKERKERKTIRAPHTLELIISTHITGTGVGGSIDTESVLIMSTHITRTGVGGSIDTESVLIMRTHITRTGVGGNISRDPEENCFCYLILRKKILYKR
jgi:hypothetical protein